MFFVQNEQSDVLSGLFLSILTRIVQIFRLPDGKTGAFRQPENRLIGRKSGKIDASLLFILWFKRIFRLLNQRAGEKKPVFVCGDNENGLKVGLGLDFRHGKSGRGASYRFTKFFCGFLNYP